MFLRKIFNPLLVICGLLSVQLSAQVRPEQDHSRHLEELNERDWEAVREYLKFKREEDQAKQAPQVIISGDIRFEYRNLHEREVGKTLRGGRFANKCGSGQCVEGLSSGSSSSSSRSSSSSFSSSSSSDSSGAVEFGDDGSSSSSSSHSDRRGFPISNNDFDVEFNLRFDYKGQTTWAVAHLQYDNSAGVDDGELDCCFNPFGWHGSGNCDDLCLKKAFWGIRLYEDGCERIEFELGRRNLYNLFDSRVQFLSRFDGATLKYFNCWDCIGDWYWYLAGFVVDERVNHFAWVTEIGFLDIVDSGIDLKYSLIDWQKFGRNRCHVVNPRGFKFLISQVTGYYHFNPEFLRVKAKVFGAYLYNHRGRHMAYRNFRKHHQVCRTDRDKFRIDNGHAFAPEDTHKKIAKDQNAAWYVGVLLGEVEKQGDWSFEIQYQWVQAFAIPEDDMGGIGRGNTLDDYITAIGARGNTNFKGWRFEGLYAITDDLTIDTIFEFSQQIDRRIGGSHHYSKFEVETIYAF